VEGSNMSQFSNELGKYRKTNLREEIKGLLDEESYKDFQDALSNRFVSVTAIMAALKTFNVEVSENTIRRWRNEAVHNV
jgi:hypothetical protein